MSQTKPSDFKYYKVTYPNGEVTDVSLHKSAGSDFAVEIIKRIFFLIDKKSGLKMKPVKVRRYK